MYGFNNPHITIADFEDIVAIKKLLDEAYRGNSSRQGWTTEADLIEGEKRTDEAGLERVMMQSGSIFLKYSGAQQEIIACVNLQQHGQKIYLGMFSVLPSLQGGGIGKQILQAAEEYATYLECTAIYMSVISVRSELIDWYKRHGYTDTGERIPFIEDEVSGKHLQPLEFMVLEKVLSN